MPRGIYKRTKSKKPIARERVRGEFDVIKWINAADTPAERQLRKAAMHGVLYSGIPVKEEGLLHWAERIRNQIAETAARKEQLSKEGIETVRWPGNAGCQQSNIPKEDTDPVNHPAHYNWHPSGVECIDIAEHFNFNRGNAIKYIWRSDEKGSTLEQLRKARWYLDREIERLEKEATK